MMIRGFIAAAERHAIEFGRVDLLDLVGCMDPPKAKNCKTCFVRADPARCKH